MEYLFATLVVFGVLAWFYVRDEEHDEFMDQLLDEFREDLKMTEETITDFNRAAHPAIIDNFHARWEPFIEMWTLNHAIRQMHKKSKAHTIIDNRFLYN